MYYDQNNVIISMFDKNMEITTKILKWLANKIAKEQLIYNYIFLKLSIKLQHFVYKRQSTKY